MHEQSDFYGLVRFFLPVSNNFILIDLFILILYLLATSCSTLNGKFLAFTPKHPEPLCRVQFRGVGDSDVPEDGRWMLLK
jgi:hypothetical protein